MIDHSSGSDILLGLLQDMRPARATYGQVTIASRVGIELPFEDGVRFHLVVEGGCVIDLPHLGHQSLASGDIVLLPHGTRHTLLTEAGGHSQPLASLDRRTIGADVYQLRTDGTGEQALLVCCTVGFDAPAAKLLLADLPPLIVVQEHERSMASDIGPVISLLAEEARRVRMGMATLLPRLADIIIVWTLRQWAETQASHAKGWLGALYERGIGDALRAIHIQPEKSWTLPTLARIAGMSRTVFAQRFQERLGISPGRYLTQWRMAMAKDRLREPGATLAIVADGLGYGSEAAFARAFKRETGYPPGHVRHMSPA